MPEKPTEGKRNNKILKEKRPADISRVDLDGSAKRGTRLLFFIDLSSFVGKFHEISGLKEGHTNAIKKGMLLCQKNRGYRMLPSGKNNLIYLI
jgi:hypothetical protein